MRLSILALLALSALATATLIQSNPDQLLLSHEVSPELLTKPAGFLQQKSELDDATILIGKGNAKYKNHQGKFYCDEDNECSASKVGNGECDDECNVEECEYDDGDCRSSNEKSRSKGSE